MQKFMWQILNCHSYVSKLKTNGKLENGKDAKIVLDGNFANLLEDRGYVLEGDGSFTLPVKGLKTVAENFDDAKKQRRKLLQN